jgi:MFS family permease
MKLFEEYRGLSRGLYILALGRLVTAMGSMVWSMMTMILSVKLELSAGTISRLLTAAMLAEVPLSLIGGRIADHFPRRNVIIVCDLISIAGLFYCALVPLTFSSMLIFAVAALLQSMEGPSYTALVADLSGSRDRERAYSLNYLALNLGMILSPTIGGLLFKEHLHLSFLINGLAIGISTILIAAGLPAQKPAAAAGEQQNKGSVKTVLSAHPVLLLYLCYAALAAAVYSQASVLMPLDLGAAHGEDGAFIYGIMSSLNCLTVVLFTPFFTRKLGHWKEPAKLVLAGVFLMAGFGVFVLARGRAVFCCAAVPVYTWAEILIALGGDPYLTRRVPASFRGRLLGLGTALSTFAYAGLMLAAGELYDSRGSAFTWGVILALGGLSIVLAVILMKKDRRDFADLYDPL